MSPDQRFEILKIEISLIQKTLDKYDDLIFRGRNSFVTLWLAALGLAFTIKSEVVPLLVVAMSLAYWFLEGMMRHQYWFKYVDRYRFLRCKINEPEPALARLPVYDLTNHFNRAQIHRWKKIKACFFKFEPSVLYGVMGIIAFVLWVLLHCEILSFSGGA
ncbi:MAG: hypothetical protein ACXIUZ_08800 [Lysobacteraceae bacterium]